MKFLHKNKSTLLGLEVGSHRVKVLELKCVAGQYRVEHFNVLPIPQIIWEREDLKKVNFIVKVLQEAVIGSKTTLKQVAMYVPSASVTIQRLLLDAALQDKALETQLVFEASAHIPYPMTEVYFDFHILESSLNEVAYKKDVLFVASPMDQIDRYRDILAKTQLDLCLVDVECFVLARACSLMAYELPNKGINKTMAVINLYTHSISLTVLHNFEVVYTGEEFFNNDLLENPLFLESELIFEAIGDFKENSNLPEKYNFLSLNPFNESLLLAIRRCIQLFYFTHSHFSIDNIILSGDGSDTPRLKSWVEENMDIQTYVANPFSHMSVAPGVDSSFLNENASSFMLCCGLAMRNLN